MYLSQNNGITLHAQNQRANNFGVCVRKIQSYEGNWGSGTYVQ